MVHAGGANMHGLPCHGACGLGELSSAATYASLPSRCAGQALRLRVGIE